MGCCPSRYRKVENKDSLMTDVEAPRRKMSGVGAAMEVGTFDPAMQMLPPIINGLWFYDKAPRLEAFIQLFEKHVWPCYRFSSLMDGGYWKACASMDKAYHFREVVLRDEAAIDAYVQQNMMQPLDMTFPPWTLTVLRAAPPSRSAVLMRLHHTIGDGLGLIIAFSPYMGCEGGDVLAKCPLPPAVLPPSYQKKDKDSKSKSSSGFSLACCSAIRMFCKGAGVVLCSTPDAELSINAPLEDRTPFVKFNGQRVYTRLPAISMTRIKAICKKHSCTVNDALMAGLTGALHNYGGEVRGDERLQDDGPDLNFTALVMIGLPRPIDESNLMSAIQNNMLFATCQLPVDDPTPYGRLTRTMEEFNNLKSKPYMAGLNCLTKCLSSSVPTGMMQKAVSETFSKHTLLVSNVPGPVVPVTYPKEGGEVIKEVHMVFPNVVPQVSFISYNGFVYANLVADPQLFPEPTKFGAQFTAEFGALEHCQASDVEWEE